MKKILEELGAEVAGNLDEAAFMAERKGLTVEDMQNIKSILLESIGLIDDTINHKENNKKREVPATAGRPCRKPLS